MIKPLLAATVESYDDLAGKFPLLASPKLDGIRALKLDGKIVSRNLKAIPNKHVQKLFAKLPDFLDGELIVGDPTSPTCFRDTSSGVMSVDGTPDVMFYIFDKYDCSYTFEQRQQLIKQWIKFDKPHKQFVKIVPQVLIKDAFELHEYETTMIGKGYEGVMLRSAKGAYKEGRSTLKEGILMKLKKFADSEAEILDIIELQHNENEKTKDNLGHSKRSSHKAGKVAAGTMGALLVRDIHTKVEFQIGAGFTDEDRRGFWKGGASFRNLIIKYKYFPTGSKDKPRFPVFLGFRDARDMS